MIIRVRHSVAKLLRQKKRNLYIKQQLASTAQLRVLLKSAEQMLHHVIEGEMPPRTKVEEWLSAVDEYFGRRQ